MISEIASSEVAPRSPSHGEGSHLSWWQRSAIVAALTGVVALAWAYLYLHSAHQDRSMAGHMAAGMSTPSWTPAQAGLTLAMWAVMMAAMMLPSAAPAVLTFAQVSSRLTAGTKMLSATAFFVAGYLAVWSGFSVGATALQWGLESRGLLDPVAARSGPLLGAGLLILAGLYQLGLLKYACLQACRTPLHFIAAHWRDGPGGALRLGLRHGLYCLGCCWAVMLLLFVGGVMNLLSVAVISVFVLTEKLTPAGSRTGRWISGGALIVVGTAIGVLSG